MEKELEELFEDITSNLDTPETTNCSAKSTRSNKNDENEKECEEDPEETGAFTFIKTLVIFVVVISGFYGFLAYVITNVSESKGMTFKMLTRSKSNLDLVNVCRGHQMAR